VGGVDGASALRAYMSVAEQTPIQQSCIQTKVLLALRS
jgi:hypothetical protein